MFRQKRPLGRRHRPTPRRLHHRRPARQRPDPPPRHRHHSLHPSREPSPLRPAPPTPPVPTVTSHVVGTHHGASAINPRPHPSPQKTNSLSPSIAVENLTFRYDPHSSRVTLSDITLPIAAGKVTAIVGASGSGKTTLIKLLLGYYRPEKGTITVGAENLSAMNLRQWRRRCGVVMQEGVIFSESIARNIAVADGPIDPACLEEAARIACIHDFITGLPLGYNTVIGRDGIGISQGQKQRILIARSLPQPRLHLPRRSHQLARRRQRARNRRKPRPLLPRPHSRNRSPPPLHRPPCRLHRSPRFRPHRRERHPRRPHRPPRRLLHPRQKPARTRHLTPLHFSKP